MELRKETSLGIPQLLRLLADAMEEPNNREMAGKLSQLVVSLALQLLPSSLPPITQVSQDYHFAIAKGCIGTIAEVIWTLIELGKIVIVDKDGNEIKVSNKQNAAEWFSKQLFGYPIKKWDQTIEAAFGRKNAMDIFWSMLNVGRDKINGKR